MFDRWLCTDTIQNMNQRDRFEIVRFSTAIGGKYMGADRAEEGGARNGVEGEFLVRITPTRIIAHDDVAGGLRARPNTTGPPFGGPVVGGEGGI